MEKEEKWEEAEEAEEVQVALKKMGLLEEEWKQEEKEEMGGEA